MIQWLKNYRVVLGAFIVVLFFGAFAWFNGLPYTSRATSGSPDAYTLYGINRATGQLASHRFSDAASRSIGTVRLSDGTVLTGIAASAHTPRNTNLFGFWTDPTNGLNKLVYINTIDATASVVGLDMGANRVTGAVSVKAAAGSTLADDKPTPTQEITQHELYAIQNDDGLGDIKILVLDPHINGALSMKGGAALSVTGTIQVNSRSSTSVVISNNSVVQAPRITTAGSVDGDPVKAATVIAGAQSVPDPLATLPAPTWDPTADLGAVTLSTGTQKITPGYYSGGIELSQDAHLEMAPGLYVLDGKGLKVSGAAGLTAQGVTLYLTGSAAVNLSGSGGISLTPPTQGTYAQVSIFQDRQNTKDSNFAGGAGLDLHGTLYLPAAFVKMSGNGSSFGDWVIVNKLEASGASHVAIGTTPTPTSRLIKVNPNDASTQTVMPLSRIYDGLAAQTSAMFYATSGDALYRIDPATQTETLVGPVAYTDARALAFMGPRLCCFASATDRVIPLDTITGVAVGLPQDMGATDLETITFVRNADVPVGGAFD